MVSSSDRPRLRNYFSTVANLTANDTKTIPEILVKPNLSFMEPFIHVPSTPAAIATAPKTTSVTQTINASS